MEGENRISFKSDVERLQQTRRVYRAAQDVTNKLESIIKHKQAYRMVFEKDAIEMRMRLRDLCERLMFLHPTDFGRKAEEILWWKVYYNVINLAKKSKKYMRSGSSLECAYRTHLLAATGFYHHLLMRLKWEYGLREDHATDFMSFPDEDQEKDIGNDANAIKAKDWAQKACQRCLIYLGDLARYRQEYEGPGHLLAERFYHQALIVNPAMGMPHNQLGTLAGMSYQGVNAAYHYMRCWLSDLRFDGAIANLEKIFERNQKRYHELSTVSSPDLPPELQRPRDIKQFLIRFLYLQELFQPSNKTGIDNLPSLCQDVLLGFHQCMLHSAATIGNGGPGMGQGHTRSEDGREGYLSNDVVFKLVALTLMSTYRLQKAGSKQTSTAVVFTLALLSYTLNHLCEKLNNAVYRKMYPEQTSAATVHANDSDGSSNGRASPANTITQDANPEMDSDGTVKLAPKKAQQKKLKPKAALKAMRRRRKRVGLGADTSEDSDLSEGEQGVGGAHTDGSSESGGEGCGDALVAESDSEYFMDSQELELEDEETSGKPHTQEEPPSHPSPTPEGILGGVSDKLVEDISSRLIAPPGPSHTPPGRRNIKLAPTFDAYTKEMGSPQVQLSRDVPESQETSGETAEISDNTVASSHKTKAEDEGPPVQPQGSPAAGTGQIPVPVLMEILTEEGLLPVVKILTDWLRTNEDFIIKTAQSSQPLWARLANLLNLCPNEKLIVNQDWCSSTPIRQLLEASLDQGCGRDWCQPMPLTEDIALWLMPPLQSLHKEMAHDCHHEMDLTQQDEMVVRILCLRQFGYYLTGIRGISLLYENSQFSSPAPDTQKEDREECHAPSSASQSRDAKIDLDEQKVEETTSCAAERREKVMREMAQLRLQSEVNQLEGTIDPMEDDPLSPFLIPVTAVLTNQLATLRSLVATSRFIVVIPKAVIAELDVNKKSQARARDAIKFMEREFQNGNRYLKAQKEDESMPFEDKPTAKTDDQSVRTFCSIAECAHFFAVHGSPILAEMSSPCPSRMVTLLTDREPVENPIVVTTISRLLNVGVDVTTAKEFMAKWQARV
ncbi:nonsense-mediated mRNA decay factor SMG5-like [Diadema setosum]|uniref:nonsense-mediated mRNA decay factor SMG5-like n=1 Tax=Diadema setosum TaxID=31175 RepID=UPI003B3B0067